MRADRLRPFALFLIALLSGSACASTENWRWSDVERVVAVSDVHGAYGALVRTLRNAAVLDEQDGWAGGAAHLVAAGDILDRGPDSRRVMDLLMRLEAEAAAAGGRVHVLLGNHEVMNLVGDLRYVSEEEFAAFADDETAADRERAFAAFAARHAGKGDDAELRLAFERRAPPGFFAHRRAFSPEGRYGKWLLDKPFAVVIGDTAFVHGGLSPTAAAAGLAGINGRMKDELAAYAAYRWQLTGAGILDATENFSAHADRLRALPGDPGRPAALQDAVAGAIELHDAAIHDLDSPIWYRGNAACGPLVESDKLDAALARLGATRVVIGHTPTASRRVESRLGGRVLQIDTGMLAAVYDGSGHALVMEGDRLLVVEENGTTVSAPLSQGAGPAADRTAESRLERVLAAGEIGPGADAGSDGAIVSLRQGDQQVSARFSERARGRGFYPGIAAYRLDRLLGLGMVAVTVAREVEGRQGTLQRVPEGGENELTRRESGDGYAAWCPLPEQWQALYVFDTLIGNAGRDPRNMLYDPRSWQLTLVGHERAFGTEGGRPAYLERVELRLGPAWRAALRSLSDEVLEDVLGDVLDGRRLRALGKRRDELLEAAREQGVSP